MRVAILGGTGFVGSCLTRVLDRRGVEYITVSRAPVRDPRHRAANVTRPAELQAAVAGCTDIVNLVAASPLLPAGNDARYFRCHVALPRELVRLCEHPGGSRLVHVGALGVTEESTTAYARTKARGERLVAASRADAITLSPSILFGRRSELIRVLSFFARFPVVPLPQISTAFEPIYVGDFAETIADAVERTGAFAYSPRRVEIIGPERMSGTEYAEIYLCNAGCRIVAVPEAAVNLALAAGSRLSLPFFPRDLPEMLRLRNIASGAEPFVRTSTRYAEWCRLHARIGDALPSESRVI